MIATGEVCGNKKLPKELNKSAIVVLRSAITKFCLYADKRPADITDKVQRRA